MEEFKLNFYFNLYKDKVMQNRDVFRANFHKLHGNFNYLEELIKMIENYQIKTYGCTLHSNEINDIKRRINDYNNGREQAVYVRRCKK